MTVRVYQNWARHAQSPSRRYLRWLTWLLLAASVVGQFLFPFLTGSTRNVALLIAIYAGAALALTHSLGELGARYAATLAAVTLLFGFGVLESNAWTSWPFGHVLFSNALGFRLDRTPLVLVFAWLAMMFPVLVVSRQIAARWTPLVGAFGLTAWTLLVDPIMNTSGYWSWDTDVKRTPGIPGTPLSAVAGWLLVGLLLTAVLHWTLPRDSRRQQSNTMPIDLFLLFTLAASIVANVRSHHSSVVLIAGLALSVVLVPYAVSKWLARP